VILAQCRANFPYQIRSGGNYYYMELYDEHEMANTPMVTLTPREKEGMNVSRSFVARCAECHTPPLFTNQQVAVIKVMPGP
jgi:hypothetical protein